MDKSQILGCERCLLSPLLGSGDVSCFLIITSQYIEKTKYFAFLYSDFFFIEISVISHDKIKKKQIDLMLNVFCFQQKVKKQQPLMSLFLDLVVF